jgi:hypothetical protein
MGIKGRRVHMIEELSETIISFQRGKRKEKELKKKQSLTKSLKSKATHSQMCLINIYVRSLTTHTHAYTHISILICI